MLGPVFALTQFSILTLNPPSDPSIWTLGLGGVGAGFAATGLTLITCGAGAAESLLEHPAIKNTGIIMARDLTMEDFMSS
jgi:hypothetical protein